MYQSTTKGILHFEDLDSKMLEAMCCNIIVESGLFDDIRPYGIEGADEGVAIFGGWIGSCEVRVLKDQRLKTPFPIKMPTTFPTGTGMHVQS